MSLKKYQITSIDGGISNQYATPQRGMYLDAIGIDPDLAITTPGGTVDIRKSGIIYPSSYTKFSGSEINGVPIRFITAAEVDNKVFVVLANGKIISYTNTLSTATTVGTVAGSNAAGAFRYNNYIYITGTGASFDDVSRYGPLDGSASLVDNVWKGSTLGSQTALTNTTYPSSLPNHWGISHVDGAAYFIDFKDGRGLIHKIKTTGTSPVGGTNDNSAYNVLDLPPGWYPISLSSYDTNIAIIATQTTSSNGLRQGNAAMFLWDTISRSFYRQVPLPDVVASAIINKNNQLYIFTGATGSTGVRVSVYDGAFSVSQVAFLEKSAAPMPGAVDAYGGRVIFGGRNGIASVLYAIGSKDEQASSALHCVARSTSPGNSGSAIGVSAVGFVLQASAFFPRPIIGWTDASTFGIDKWTNNDFGETTLSPTFTTEVIQIGKRFKVRKIEFNTSYICDANRRVKCNVFTDNFENASTTFTTTVNDLLHIFQRPTLNIGGRSHLYFTFTFEGTKPLPVELPINVWIEEFDN